MRKSALSKGSRRSGVAVANSSSMSDQVKFFQIERIINQLITGVLTQIKTSQQSLSMNEHEDGIGHRKDVDPPPPPPRCVGPYQAPVAI